MLDRTQNRYPCPRAKEKSQKYGRKGETEFRIKSHTHQRCLEGSNKTLCTPGDPTETEPGLPLSVSCGGVSSGLPQGQGLWVQQAWVWHKPSWRRSPLTHHRAARTYTGLGKQTLGEHKQNLMWCAPGPRRKEQWPHRRLTQTCPWASRSLWWRRGLVVPCCRLGALSASVPAWDLLKEVAIIFIVSTIVWSQVKQQGRNTVLPINRKLD